MDNGQLRHYGSSNNFLGKSLSILANDAVSKISLIHSNMNNEPNKVNLKVRQSHKMLQRGLFLFTTTKTSSKFDSGILWKKFS